MTTYYHKHHIIPKHAGGTDDPSNLVRLTVEEHAEAHRLLFEEHGRWQDKVAWQALSGRIGKEEAIRLTQVNSGYERTPEHRKMVSERNKGYKHTPEAIAKIAKRSQERAKSGQYHNKEAVDKLRKAYYNQPKLTCPHCGIKMIRNLYSRYHGDKCRFQ